LTTYNETKPNGKTRLNSFSLYLFQFIVSESQNSIPSPTYTNDKLLQIINQKKNHSWIFLNGLNLTSEDMEIVYYYLLQNNTVMIIERFNLKYKISSIKEDKK
jgi:hypothetical protein